MDSKKQNGSIIAIITMMFLYAMISFVTNLAAPVGVIWKGAFDGSNTVGMLGNMMNFLAYLFMGIPAGKLLTRIGYKKTALAGIGTGFVGVLIQFISGSISGTPGFVVYLLGAFISGFCVCMLNTVVNPMLNLLGGGGNRGNQLNLIGGTLNSLAGTLTPLFVGALIGDASKASFSDVNPVISGNAAAIAGSVAATYWLLMLVGRFGSSFFASKVSSKTMMTVTTITAMTLIVLAMLLGKSTQVSMPVFTGASFEMVTVPVAALLLVLCGLCTSIMWASIFNLATEGLGKYTAAASGIFMMMVVGGGVLPLIQNFIADHAGYLTSYIVPLAGVAYMCYYALIGSKNVNKDIPV